MPKAITTLFLTLILKGDNPQEINDFRPICIIDSIYRILSKILANRIKNVMNILVSKSQTSFLAGRQMLDGILVVNEVLDFARHNKEKGLLVKVNFAKVYTAYIWVI